MREIQQIYNLLRAALTGDKPHVGEEQIEASQWWRLFRLLQHNLVGTQPQQQETEQFLKALIQQYMSRMNENRLLPDR